MLLQKCLKILWKTIDKKAFMQGRDFQLPFLTAEIMLFNEKLLRKIAYYAEFFALFSLLR
jgi:hypothetical protein